MAVDRFMAQPPFTVGRPSGQATLEPEPGAASLTLGRCHAFRLPDFVSYRGPVRLLMGHLRTHRTVVTDLPVSGLLNPGTGST